MSLSNIKKMKDERGFTIVELLIVIVIIAILAAIVFVAYTSITGRANDSGYKADAASIVKAMEVYNADNGSYATSLTINNLPSSTASLPQNIRLTTTTNAPTQTSVATTDCATAQTGATPWAVCQESGSSVKYYAVRGMSSSGACVYYLQTTGSGSGVKSLAAGTASC